MHVGMDVHMQAQDVSQCGDRDRSDVVLLPTRGRRSRKRLLALQHLAILQDNSALVQDGSRRPRASAGFPSLCLKLIL